MQEGYRDYYALEDNGCCLHCNEATEGCLCFNCKCKNCFWYTSPQLSGCYDDEGEPKGSCDIAYEEKEDRRGKENFYEKQFEKYNPKTPQKNLLGKFIRRKIIKWQEF